MFDVRSDPKKNRLYICLAGYLEDEEVQRIAAAVMAEVKQLQDGFTLVSDVSGLHPSHESSLRMATKVLRMLKMRGLRRAVRVSRIIISRLQLERASEEAGVVMEQAASLDQAEALLDAPGRAG